MFSSILEIVRMIRCFLILEIIIVVDFFSYV
jgi:hypothetical protein